MWVEITLILAAKMKKKINTPGLRACILPSAVFLPWGLDLMKAAKRLEAVSSVMMTNTRNVISDHREDQFYSVQIEVVDFRFL